MISVVPGRRRRSQPSGRHARRSRSRVAAEFGGLGSRIDHPVAQYWASKRPFDMRHVPNPVPHGRRRACCAPGRVDRIGRTPPRRPRPAPSRSAMPATTRSWNRRCDATASPGPLPLKAASLDHAMWWHRFGRVNEAALRAVAAPPADADSRSVASASARECRTGGHDPVPGRSFNQPAEVRVLRQWKPMVARARHPVTRRWSSGAPVRSQRGCRWTRYRRRRRRRHRRAGHAVPAEDLRRRTRGTVGDHHRVRPPPLSESTLPIRRTSSSYLDAGTPAAGDEPDIRGQRVQHLRQRDVRSATSL